MADTHVPDGEQTPPAAAAWPDPPEPGDDPVAATDVARALARLDAGRLADPQALADQLAAVAKERDAARTALAALRASASYNVGVAITRGAKSPRTAILQVPRDILAVRRRSKPATPRAVAPAVVNVEKPSPRTLFAAFDPPAPDPFSRLRLAVVGSDETLRRLDGPASVVRLRPNGAAGALASTSPDAVVVAASAGDAGPWSGLGKGESPDRDADLDDLLAAASASGVPVVLLVDVPTAERPGLRYRMGRFDHVVGSADDPWSPGVRLDLDGPLRPRQVDEPDFVPGAGPAADGTAQPSTSTRVVELAELLGRPPGGVRPSVAVMLARGLPEVPATTWFGAVDVRSVSVGDAGLGAALYATAADYVVRTSSAADLEDLADLVLALACAGRSAVGAGRTGAGSRLAPAPALRPAALLRRDLALALTSRHLPWDVTGAGLVAVGEASS